MLLWGSLLGLSELKEGKMREGRERGRVGWVKPTHTKKNRNQMMFFLGHPDKILSYPCSKKKKKEKKKRKGWRSWRKGKEGREGQKKKEGLFFFSPSHQTED